MFKIKRILIIDDDADYGPMLCRRFQTIGFKTMLAAEGQEGLDKAESFRPSVILLDIHMPEMDGLKVLQQLKRDWCLSAIPVILITGQEIIDSVLDAVAERFQTGPIYRKSEPLAALTQRVEKIISLLSCERQALPNGLRRRDVVQIDTRRKAVKLGSQPLLRLAGKRFDLFCALLCKERRVSRQELLMEVWDENTDINTVGVTMQRLREDLRGFPCFCIKSYRDGYELVLRFG